MILRVFIFLLLVPAFISLPACTVTEPEGPGEQIGKGIDLISKGLQDIDKDSDVAPRAHESEAERRRREEDDRRRWEEEYERERRYDSEPRYQDDTDFSSKRRY